MIFGKVIIVPFAREKILPYKIACRWSVNWFGADVVFNGSQCVQCTVKEARVGVSKRKDFNNQLNKYWSK